MQFKIELLSCSVHMSSAPQPRVAMATVWTVRMGCASVVAESTSLGPSIAACSHSWVLGLLFLSHLPTHVQEGAHSSTPSARRPSLLSPLSLVFQYPCPASAPAPGLGAWPLASVRCSWPGEKAQRTTTALSGIKAKMNFVDMEGSGKSEGAN